MKIFKIVIPLIVISLTLSIYKETPKNHCQRFAEQAQSFIHGHLDINSQRDSVYKNGKYYWPQGPFPSLILIPFQLVFGPKFDQTVMQPFLVLLLAITIYQLTKRKNFNREDPLMLTYGFFFLPL